MNKSSIVDKPFLSVAMITFNEERIIEKTISVLHNWVDEIIVIDSYSTDNTLNILELFNVNVVQEKWQGYSRQKNLALSKCRGEWILSLDADEVVTDRLKEEIQKTIKEPGIDVGFKIPRKFYIGKKWIQYGGYYPDAQLRLFKRGVGAAFKERAVHESVDIGDKPMRLLENAIEHYAYKDIGDYKASMEKYSKLAASEIKNKKFYIPFFRALWAFVYRYIFRLGFLEGELGFNLVWIYSLYVYSKYSQAKEINKN